MLSEKRPASKFTCLLIPFIQSSRNDKNYIEGKQNVGCQELRTIVRVGGAGVEGFDFKEVT